MNKLYNIINPPYTSVFVVIIFTVASVSSQLSIFSIDGKTYVNSKYKIVYGGSKTLDVNGNIITGLKSYRSLTDKEKRMVRKKNIQRRKEAQKYYAKRAQKQRAQFVRKWKENTLKIQKLGTQNKPRSRGVGRKSYRHKKTKQYQ